MFHKVDKSRRNNFSSDRLKRVFHLEGGVNVKRSVHWSTENPHWLIKKSLNSPKVMVSAAIGHAGIVGPFSSKAMWISRHT